MNVCVAGGRRSADHQHIPVLVELSSVVQRQVARLAAAVHVLGVVQVGLEALCGPGEPANLQPVVQRTVAARFTVLLQTEAERHAFGQKRLVVDLDITHQLSELIGRVDQAFVRLEEMRGLFGGQR